MNQELLVPVEGDPAVMEFARLAKGLQGDAGRRDDASFAKVGAKVQRLQARRRVASIAVAAVAVIGIALGSFVATRTQGITYQVVNGAMVDGDHVVAGADTQIRFSDGSEVRLEPGADTHVRALDEHGGRVSIDEGTARVAIAKRPGAAWTVAAGPYTVKVTGTAFSVQWSKKEQAFEIAMVSGSVIVSGPLVGSGMTLHAGQRVRTGLVNGKLELDTTDGVRSKAASVAPESPDIDALSPSEADAPLTPGSAGLPGGALDWARRAAQGEFTAVIEAAERRGLENTLSTASLSDLAALADSARYARRGALAKRVLLAERKRFPASGAAREAAFFLGRLAEDDGSGALEWYDRYLADSPRGTYASQALGRKMMLVYQQRGVTGARAIADDYLTRFPSGPYAAAARKIQDEPTTPAP
jgi:hypothetical protein